MAGPIDRSDDGGSGGMDVASYFARRADRAAELLAAADDEVLGDAAAAPSPTTRATRGAPSRATTTTRGASPARREEWGRSEPRASEWSRVSRMRVRGRAIALPERASASRSDGTSETQLRSADGSDDEDDVDSGDDDDVVARVARALADQIMQCEVEEELAPLVAAIRGLENEGRSW